jgi:hypothetical protein
MKGLRISCARTRVLYTTQHPRSTQSLSTYKTQGLDLPYTLDYDLDSAGRDVE